MGEKQNYGLYGNMGCELIQQYAVDMARAVCVHASKVAGADDRVTMNRRFIVHFVHSGQLEKAASIGELLRPTLIFHVITWQAWLAARAP